MEMPEIEENRRNEKDARMRTRRGRKSSSGLNCMCGTYICTYYIQYTTRAKDYGGAGNESLQTSAHLAPPPPPKKKRDQSVEDDSKGMVTYCKIFKDEQASARVNIHT